MAPPTRIELDVYKRQEFALVWKRYAVFSRASEYFLRQLREELGLPPDWFEA